MTPSKPPSTAASPDLEIKDGRQSEFYEGQSIVVTRFITGNGVPIASLMAIGALKTMASAGAVRTLEISTLRARSFARPLARRLVRS